MAEAKIVITGADRSQEAIESAKRGLSSLASKAGELPGKFTAIATAVAGVVATLQVKQSIDVLDKLDEMAEKTGIATETLSGLRYAGEVAGTTFEALTTGLRKLSLHMAEAAGGGKEATALFKAFGVEIQNSDGSLRSQEQVLLDLADKFAGYEDGAGKSAAVQKLFGKSGEDMIPILNKGREGISALTAEAKGLGAVYGGPLAADAASFNDNLARLKLAAEAATVSLFGGVIPAILRLSDELIEGKKAFGGYLSAMVQLGFKNGGFDSYADGAKNARSEVAKLEEQLNKLDSNRPQTRADTGGGAAMVGPSLGYAKAPQAQRDAVTQELENARKRLSYFEALQKKEEDRNAPAPATDAGKKKPPPTITAGDATPKDDPTKKLLDNRLKALENEGNEERQLLSDRNKMLDLYNGQSLLSVERYYEGRRGAAEEAVQAQIAIYDREIAALQEYQKGADKESDRVEAQGKIAEVRAKQDALRKQVGQQNIELDIQQRAAQENLGRTITGINADLLEQQERLGEAAAIRFDNQNVLLLRKLIAEGNTDAQQQLASLRQLTVARADFTRETNLASRTTADLQLAEDRIAISRKLGATTELGSLQQLARARAAAVAQMETIVSEQERIAEASGNPALIQQARRARGELEQLASTMDPLGDKFRGIFEDAAGNAFADFITGTKTASEAFKAFGNSVISELGRIGAQTLAQGIFGKVGSLGGVVSSVANLFGLGSPAASAATEASSLYSLSSGSKGLGLSFGGPRASGGNVDRGKFYEVNENNPELLTMGGRTFLMMGDASGFVTPPGGIAGGAPSANTNAGSGSFTLISKTSKPLEVVEERRMSNGEIIAYVQEQASSARSGAYHDVANGFTDPGSRVSRGVARGFRVQRTKG
ncbi:hypothetical protein GN316_15330 [Xylophilus sp. Kf1]|nr:hypothetical protein [Xylophilus sp. Kf1]